MFVFIEKYLRKTSHKICNYVYFYVNLFFFKYLQYILLTDSMYSANHGGGEIFEFHCVPIVGSFETVYNFISLISSVMSVIAQFVSVEEIGDTFSELCAFCCLFDSTHRSAFRTTLVFEDCSLAVEESTGSDISFCTLKIFVD